MTDRTLLDRYTCSDDLRLGEALQRTSTNCYQKTVWNRLSNKDRLILCHFQLQTNSYQNRSNDCDKLVRKFQTTI